VRQEEKNLLSTVPAPFNILALFLGMLGSMIAMSLRFLEHAFKQEEEQFDTNMIREGDKIVDLL
jgi:hypothetical protein